MPKIIIPQAKDPKVEAARNALRKKKYIEEDVYDEEDYLPVDPMQILSYSVMVIFAILAASKFITGTM